VMCSSNSAIRSDGHIGELSAMRVLIAAPRKTGNAQLRCLLASAYGLELVNSRDAPDDADFSRAASWLGELPDRSVAHTSYRHTVELETLAAQLGVALVAVLRHPFDLFVSIHEIAQRRTDKKRRRTEAVAAWAPLGGTELDDPAVLAYLREGFSAEIAWLKAWHDSGVPIVRFEVLEADPSQVLTGLSAHLGPLGDDVVARAVAICPAENLVRSSSVRGRRMPAVSAGSWRERLSADHIAILRDRYGEDVERLGYELS
jgi:hypothetical protein